MWGRPTRFNQWSCPRHQTTGEAFVVFNALPIYFPSYTDKNKRGSLSDSCQSRLLSPLKVSPNCQGPHPLKKAGASEWSVLINLTDQIDFLQCTCFSVWKLHWEDLTHSERHGTLKDTNTCIQFIKGFIIGKAMKGKSLSFHLLKYHKCSAFYLLQTEKHTRTNNKELHRSMLGKWRKRLPAIRDTYWLVFIPNVYISNKHRSFTSIRFHQSDTMTSSKRRNWIISI